MDRFRCVPLLAGAGRHVTDAAARDQHFDQKGQEGAYRKKKREPESDEQGNSGLITKRADEKKQRRQRRRHPSQSRHHHRGVEDLLAAAKIGQAQLQPATLDGLGRFQFLRHSVDAIGHPRETR